MPAPDQIAMIAAAAVVLGLATWGWRRRKRSSQKRSMDRKAFALVRGCHPKAA